MKSQDPLVYEVRIDNGGYVIQNTITGVKFPVPSPALLHKATGKGTANTYFAPHITVLSALFKRYSPSEETFTSTPTRAETQNGVAITTTPTFAYTFTSKAKEMGLDEGGTVSYTVSFEGYRITGITSDEAVPEHVASFLETLKKRIAGGVA